MCNDTTEATPQCPKCGQCPCVCGFSDLNDENGDSDHQDEMQKISDVGPNKDDVPADTVPDTSVDTDEQARNTPSKLLEQSEDSPQNNELFGLKKDPQAEWDKKRINKDVLPKADVEMKDHIRNNGLDKYISDDKLKVKLTANTKALTPSEMKSKLGREWDPGIMGFNNGKRSYVDTSFGADQAKETAIHENFHQLSANDIKGPLGEVKTYQRGLSIDGRDRGLNEALTQKYTLDTMRDTNPTYTNPNCAYDDASKYMDDLYSFDGNKDMFDQAYFQNNPAALRQHFDQYGGTGFYDELSMHFDTATDPGHPQVARTSALNRISDMINDYTLNRLLAGS